MDLFISRCCAWAPGITTPDQWRQWAAGTLQPDTSGIPDAKAAPPLLRRRLTRWGRMALETACACADAVTAKTPVLFSSRHGDTQRTCALLKDLALNEPLSPKAFSLSVHNASLGVYTIVQQALGPSLALAAGKESLGHAMLEAAGLLADGADKVLLVHTDDDLAEIYQPYADEQDMPHSVALVLTRGYGRQVGMNWRNSVTDGRVAEVATESMSCAFLRWWFGNVERFEYPGSRLTWTWALENDCKDSLFF